MAERKSFLLRISPELYEKLERWAADELRSANAQIEYLLADAVRRAGRGDRSSAVERSESSGEARAGD